MSAVRAVVDINFARGLAGLTVDRAKLQLSQPSGGFWPHASLAVDRAKLQQSSSYALQLALPLLSKMVQGGSGYLSRNNTDVRPDTMSPRASAQRLGKKTAAAEIHKPYYNAVHMHRRATLCKARSGQSADLGRA